MSVFKNRWLWVTVAVVCLVAVLVAGFVLERRPVPPPPDEVSATTAASTTTVAATTVTTTAATTTTTAATTTTTTTATTTTTKAPKKELTVTSHKKTATTTDESFTVFAGSSDPDYPLLLDGVEISRDKYGSFSVERSLTPGKNTFTFTHKGKTATYTVTYNYVVMRSHSPDGNRRFESGSSFSVVVSARSGSTVTATFRGMALTLKPAAEQEEDGDTLQSDTFIQYVGSFTLPDDNTTDVDMGKVTFRAVHSGVVSTAASGTIVCKKASIPVVGEIVAFTAETFDGDKSDDDSRPTNNYLPQGTVDYVVGHSYFGDKEYLNLRCGKRVYLTKGNSPSAQIVQVAREYPGRLPDTNQLSVADLTVDERATYLTLHTAWKAPFLLDLLPQTYLDPSAQDYRVDAVTCEYVQIAFCYADAFTGEIAFGDNHPLFTHATVTQSEEGCFLRLYLRRVGGFYGWDASYDAQGRLVFYFLHPAQVTEADNAYGSDLTGVTILLDVGHGGISQGSYGLDEDHPESERNYYLATLLKAELERMGATVVMNRGADEGVNADERCMQLKAVKPDLCIAVHHDGNVSSRPHGFGSFYSTLFSVDAARCIYDATIAADIYAADTAGNRNRLEWHYYFVARMSDCPVVLTENGFMTSPVDHLGIVDPDVNLRKAQAIAAGVADYFLSIRLPQPEPEPPADPVEPTEPTESTTTTTTLPDAILPTDAEQ